MNSESGIIFDPVFPMPVIALLGLLLLFFTIRVYGKVGSSIGRWRNSALMLFRVAGLALLLAMVGLYAVMSQAVAQRGPSRRR